MVTLRLARHGNKHRPFYHVVAADHRKKLKGRHLERVGHYDPQGEKAQFTLNAERVLYWYSVGAVPSNTVAKLCKLQGIKLERAKTHTPKVAKAKKAK